MTRAPSTSATRRRTAAIHVAVLLAVSWALYAGTLGYDFTNWDDPDTVAENPYIRSAGRLGAVFDPREAGTSGIPGVYRPVWTLSYAVDYALGGMNPRVFHAHNVLLHSLNSVAVYILALALGLGAFPALVAGLFFAAHPVHVEAVAWISGRNELLLTFFFLLAFLLARFRAGLDGRPRMGMLLLSMLFLVLALLSKITAAVFVFVLYGAYRWFRTDDRESSCGRVCALRHVPYLLLSALIAAIEVFVARPGVVVQTGTEGSRAATLLTIPKLVLTYLSSLVWPLGLAPRYDTRFFQNVSAGFLLTAIGLLAVLAAAVWIARRSRVFGLSAWWFAWTLLPASNLVMLSTFRADRFLYLPSVAFSLAAALLFRRAWKRPRSLFGTARLLAVAIPALLVFHAGVTLDQTRMWRSGTALWENTVERSPGDYMAWHNLGAAHQETGRTDDALRALQRSVDLNPNWAKSRSNLGQALARSGRTEEAERHLRRAMDLDPAYAPPYASLGILYAQAGRFPEAVDILIRAIRLDPDRAVPHLNLGQVYLQMGRAEDARRELTRARDLGLPPAFRSRAEELMDAIERAR